MRRAMTTCSPRILAALDGPWRGSCRELHCRIGAPAARAAPPVPPRAHVCAVLVAFPLAAMTAAVYGRDGSYSRADTSLATAPEAIRVRLPRDLLHPHAAVREPFSGTAV